ncbi:homoserine kinase [Sinomonas cellulolyticus]|uniref:Homoserine kinase n=1 Tax=Sinomonas cellulolyticus TaxID=2801916 RepID=A0ABS1K4S6_9MICC|nr:MULTISPECIES: homoserine kinase [Sinomonas]MBL0706525.1 homoserine kinase [Sinomonas cellulolyticus]GHG45100.1 homoserine kinase [Sinomonas sp. KCTC 49339]
MTAVSEPRSDAGLRLVAPGQRVSVRVPATSANLGPGYDSLGLALALYDTVTVETAGEGGLTFDLTGEGADTLPRDESHLVVRTLDAALARLGYARSGLKLTAENVSPHGRGLGSSASATVAAVLAAAALVDPADRPDRAWALQLCSEIEGHPDNVAPAIYGSLALSWQDGDDFHTAVAQVAPEVVPIVAIPDYELSTELARSLLPSSIPHGAAAANAGRAALLVHALTRDPSLLLPATEDFLHQSYRSSAMEPSAQLIAQLRAQGHAAVVSGAGPTVLALAAGAAEADEVQAAVERFAHAADGEPVGLPGETALGEERATRWRVLRLTVDREGARVDVHPG